MDANRTGGGELVIKAKLGDDIRRLVIHNDDLTYDELIIMLTERVFKDTLKAGEDVGLKYMDEDGDLVTLADDNDLALSIRHSRYRWRYPCTEVAIVSLF